jgi:hypothetical protein
LLSQTFVESGLGPEDIIGLHCESLDGVLKGRPAREQLLATGDAHQFLLEVMIAYGVKYKELPMAFSAAGAGRLTMPPSSKSAPRVRRSALSYHCRMRVIVGRQLSELDVG